ncbi:MAG: ATP-binding protein, partial [Chthoniobacteraceae bacterium]
GEIAHDAQAHAGLAPNAIAIEIPPDLPHVRTDPGLAAQALAMLLSNAITHGSQHGSPVCRVRSDGDCIRFDVLDRGPGLPPGAEDAIFARFHRGADAKPGGLGLGLSIARQLAKTLDAKLGAANRPGGGACFTLRIPIGGEFKLPA